MILNKAGILVPRYHGKLTYSFDEQPKSVIDRFLLPSLCYPCRPSHAAQPC